jgi:hypothetical protein
MATALLASNQSAVFIRTQTVLGTFANPTTLNADGTGGNVGTYAIRAIGAPKFAVRGAGIIDRKEVFTPWGGNTSSRTGGLGWDITLQTEFFWRFGLAYDLDLSTQTQLAALWLASPWAISNEVNAGPVPPASNDTLLAVQPFFEPLPSRAAIGLNPAVPYAVQPFSMVYEETGGKRYEAKDCVALPKISWEYGQRVMIDWTIKGTWRPVLDSTDVQPVYPEQYTPTAAPQPPVIGVNCTLTVTGLTVGIDAVTKVTIDTGWTLNDVGDTRQEYGFGISFFRLDASPSLEIEMAEFDETAQASWTQAQANTIGTSIVLVMTLVASPIQAWTITLANPQYVAFPENGGETNGYRSNALKWQAIPDDSGTLLSFKMSSVP